MCAWAMPFPILKFYFYLSRKKKKRKGIQSASLLSDARWAGRTQLLFPASAFNWGKERMYFRFPVGVGHVQNGVYN